MVGGTVSLNSHYWGQAAEEMEVSIGHLLSAHPWELNDGLDGPTLS